MYDTIYGSIRLSQKINQSILITNGWKYWSYKNRFKSCFVFHHEHIIFKYFPNTKILQFATSFPKLIFGTNIKEISDIDIELVEKEIFGLLRMAINDEIVAAIPPLYQWDCSRIDYSINMFFPEKIKSQLCTVFNKVHDGHLIKIDYTTGGFNFNKSVKVGTYDKLEEMIAHNDQQWIDNETKKILRFEVGLKKRKIERMKKRKIHELLNWHTAQIILLGYLKRLKLDTVLMPKDKLFEKIKNSFSKSMSYKLICFVELINEHGLEAAKKMFKKGTYHNYLKRLRDLGVSCFYLEHASEPIDLKSLIESKITESKMKMLLIYIQEVIKAQKAMYYSYILQFLAGGKRWGYNEPFFLLPFFPVNNPLNTG